VNQETKVLGPDVATARGCTAKPGQQREVAMKVQILGTGCARCKTLTANAEKAVQELGLPTEVEKVTTIKDIMKFQILMTPGLVIDGKVKAAGRIPSPEEIKQMLLDAGGN
jgi:small redox-active disulfide protein 2